MQDLRVTLKQKGYVWNETKRAYEKGTPLAPRPSHTVVERDAGQALVRPPPVEERRSERLTVRITRHACRLLDFDNGAGGCKFLCDALRYEKLIPDDNPNVIDFQFRQVRVHRKKDEGVLIEIEPG